MIYQARIGTDFNNINEQGNKRAGRGVRPHR